MSPSIGRIVHYTLSEADAEQINRRRTSGADIAARIEQDRWPIGAQAHIGSPVVAGDICPAVITRNWGGSALMVNLQVLLDGNDTYWATSRPWSASGGPGTWTWPPRA